MKSHILYLLPGIALLILSLYILTKGRFEYTVRSSKSQTIIKTTIKLEGCAARIFGAFVCIGAILILLIMAYNPTETYLPIIMVIGIIFSLPGLIIGTIFQFIRDAIQSRKQSEKQKR